MRGGKYYFSVAQLSKFDRKSPKSQSKKTNSVGRKKVRRPKIFKSDGWYQKAALSLAISATTINADNAVNDY